MTFLPFELRWSANGQSWRLTVDPSGTPVLTDSAGVEIPPSPPAPARPGPARRGQAWTEEDEAVVRDGFAANESAAVLGERLGRSRGAVLARMVRLGLVPPEEAGLRYPVAPS